MMFINDNKLDILPTLMYNVGIMIGELICETCGKKFLRSQALAMHKAVKHEGKQYAGMIKKGQRLSPTTEFKKGVIGENTASWKGGRVKSKGGYVLIHKPGHTRITHGNYVYEHIVVWEEANKMPLPEGYVVHHLNGIKDDNRPENLLAVPRKGHSPSLLVKEVQQRLRQVEAKLAQHKLL